MCLHFLAYQCRWSLKYPSQSLEAEIWNVELSNQHFSLPMIDMNVKQYIFKLTLLFSSMGHLVKLLWRQTRCSDHLEVCSFLHRKQHTMKVYIQLWTLMYVIVVEFKSPNAVPVLQFVCVPCCKYLCIIHSASQLAFISTVTFFFEWVGLKSHQQLMSHGDLQSYCWWRTTRVPCRAGGHPGKTTDLPQTSWLVSYFLKI